jgi:diguanylate cyclase (GGDEF)-like protein/PAS domain S-box-containing protein
VINNDEIISTDNENTHQLHSEVVELLFQGSNRASISTFVVAIMLLSLLSGVITLKAAIMWLALMLAAYGYKFYLVNQFKKKSTAVSTTVSKAQHTLNWLKHFNIATLFCGLAWGASCLIIFPHNSTILQALLALVLAGISAGSLIAYSIKNSTSLFFIGGVAVFAIPAFLLEDSPYAKEIILLTGFFVLFVAMASKMLAQGLLDNIALRISADNRKNELSMLSQRQKLHMEHTPMGVIEWDANLKISSWNNAASSIFGYSYKDVVGKHISFLMPELEKQPADQIVQLLLSQESIQNNLKKVTHENGEAIFCEWHNTVLKDIHNKIVGLASLVQDKTTFIKAQNKIHQLAYYDSLTSLPNRGLLMDRLNQAVTFSVRSQSFGMVVYIDLDHFKSVNDAKGHAAGDHLLVTVANRLLNVVRKQDTVARVGGDEFVLVLSDIGKTDKEAQVFSKQIMDKIIQTIRMPVEFDNYQHQGSASIGVCIFKGDTISSDELLRRADMSMYLAKQQGRNSCKFYDETMQPKYDYQQELKNDLSTALSKNEFQLYLQGQFNQESDPVGAEVLLRWLHPKHGVISPLDFIPLAEESGLIVPIGGWVLNQACRLLKQWEASPLTNKLTLSVNVSAVQFNQVGFINEVESAIESSACNSTLLCLELTESAVVNSVEDIVYKMNYLSSMGITLSIDDFGIGYSSLAILKRLPLHELKIDKSFINDISQSGSTGTIAQTILQMGQNLGLNIVAEGVETQHQKEYLQKNGCEVFQGYLLGRPCRIEDFEKVITDKELLVA